ncbi:PLP-dependent transferase [Backusella circina FSU 941]|nr:PLP-dependent transferase [Backusella circina FSU 941]
MVLLENFEPRTTCTRQRGFSFTNLVKRTTRKKAYSVSSVYPTSQSLPKFNEQLPFLPQKQEPLLTPAQRRNSIAATQRRYEDFKQKMDEAPLFILVSTYLNYFLLILFGHLRDMMGKVFKREEYAHLRMNDGYAPLVSDFDSFFTRRMYMRVRDCWNRPITGVPGRIISVLERVTKDFNLTYTFTGKTVEAINFSSYNYLGFAQNEGVCADQVEVCTTEYGCTSASTRMEAGGMEMHRYLEQKVARFVGKEDAIVVSMGFATNSTTIPSLVSKGCLVISDELNHSSIIFGVRLSGASVRVFKHNNMKDLKRLLREVVSQGQPRTHRAWKKIVVITEGLYSMEGSIVNLPELINLKREFKFYLYVDEAHSIGALGENGRGVCDFYGIDAQHVDILMGTFTKSFGAAGGYIAGNKDVIDHLRVNNHAFIYAESMSPIVTQQIITSMSIIMGEDGTNNGVKRIESLADNSRFFANGLRKLGFIVYGDEGSPVIPLLLFNPAKVTAFSRELLKRGIAVVVVGYPATPIISSRARFCISSSHTREDLEKTLRCIDEVGELLMVKYNKR